MNRQLHYTSRGFTIVELLIVIVVIAILAAISIVAYNGVQQRSRDTIRKSDLAQIKKSLLLYETDNGDLANANCGNGSGSGWLTTDYDGAGPFLPINTCLTNGGYIAKVPIDPAGTGSCNGVTCHAYMKANCGGIVYLYANLESLPQATTDTDGTCYNTWDSSYGMNYVLRVN
jgi:general secretion pathway protein G